MIVKVPVTDVFERDGENITDCLLYGWQVKPFSVADVYALVGTPMLGEGYVDIRNFAGKGYDADGIICATVTGAYEQPDFRSHRLFDLYMGSLVKTTGNSSGYFTEITGVGGEKFYVHEKAVEKRIAGFSPEKIVQTARLFLNAPYKWGGKTVCGTDCSGFAAMCYFMCGIEIYRNADPYKTPGFVDGDINNPEIGDLVYLENHVGIYAGKGKIVHASAKEGRVTHCSVEDFLNYKKFICVRKMA